MACAPPVSTLSNTRKVSANIVCHEDVGADLLGLAPIPRSRGGITPPGVYGGVMGALNEPLMSFRLIMVAACGCDRASVPWCAVLAMCVCVFMVLIWGVIFARLLALTRHGLPTWSCV